MLPGMANEPLLDTSTDRLPPEICTLAAIVCVPLVTITVDVPVPEVPCCKVSVPVPEIK